MRATHIRSRGHLPHWESEFGTYFVTFRLNDALPQSALRELERDRFAESKGTRGLSKKLERHLDGGAGSCCLRHPANAALMVSVLSHFDGTRYRLFAYCVMPNHVHSVFQPLPGHELAKILHSWKSFSSNLINRQLSRRDILWQREYYDHLIRNGDEFHRAIRYIAENPVKAGLKNWPFVYVSTKPMVNPIAPLRELT